MREQKTKIELFTLNTLQPILESENPCVYTIRRHLEEKGREGESGAKGVRTCPVVSLRLFAQLIAFADSRRKLTDQLKM